MTVRENLGFSLHIAKRPKAEIDAAVAEAAEILSLTPLLDRKPGQLSGGQRQRVAMGRAIVRHPDVFLFDEPLSNLDAKLRTQMRVEIKRLHQKVGTTVVYVTHDQVEAMTLADRIVIMRDGHVVQVGTPLEVFERPVNSFVATFIGSPPMNLLQHAPGARAGQILGIRTEHLVLGSEGWPLVCETVELLGAERLVHARLGQESLTVRVDESVAAPAPGQAFHARPREDRVHHFDAQSGRRLEAA